MRLGLIAAIPLGGSTARPTFGQCPQGDQDTIQLLGDESNETSLQVVRGCRVRSRGEIDIGFTDYLLGMYQHVAEIEPLGTCARQPPFPDYSRAEPDKGIREYRVEMRVKYEAGDHPILFSVSSGAKELQPWQAYASYQLTGGRVLYGFCGKGFVVDKVLGTPAARPSHFAEGTETDWAMFDPESAAASGTTDLLLVFTCVRQQ